MHFSHAGGLTGRDRSAPESALKVGSAGRIGAGNGVRGLARIALDINIESYTTAGLIAFRGASEGVKAIKGE